MVRFEGKKYQAEAEESVLECLERHGISVPNSCRSGICQGCLMRTVDGNPPSSAQKGLKSSLISQNYFMACSCKASLDLEVALPNSEGFIFDTQVVQKQQLSPEIVCVRLTRPENYDYFSGQYLTLYKEAGLGRSYSLASVPHMDDYLELHVRKVAGGTVSTWIHEELCEGDSLQISHAAGNCFYVDSDPDQPLLLIGTGCGLSPLVGVIRAALTQGHRGPIKLYHGSSNAAGLYLFERLRHLSEDYPQFTFVQSQSRNAPENVRHGRATDLALADHPDLKGWRAFICGTTEVVKATRRAVFLAGTSMQDIYSDEFIVPKYC
ncbi:MAG: FAD-binding oxidoreductase [Gammaproteobacteria bacterium]|nr:FAD-binding oxidoreductase [Gammaproteobacteria bacterium]MDH5803524.1 FAD-binding oxidoreductase [Gammaproteobacteria bacterium]